MNWKDKIFESEPKKVTPTPQVTVTPAGVRAIQSAYPPGTVSEDQARIIGGQTVPAYQKLLAKTDFDQTPSGVAIAKYMQPLANLPIDEPTKIKAALAQAKAQGAIVDGDSSILSTFQHLKETLDSEAQKFAQFSAAVKARDVDGKLQQIEAKKKQIDQLNGEILTLTTDAGEAQRKISHARAEFQAALSKRKSELDQQAAHYASLLQ